jgi:uncharacterized protein (DUF1330 family)
MKKYLGLGLALLVGIAIGAGGLSALNAQNAGTGYYISELFEVSDQATFQDYVKQVPGTVAKYGGKYVVRGGKSQANEGEPPARIVVITFKTMADAQKWYGSPEYAAIKPIRQKSARSRTYIVEGLPD